MLKIIEKLHLVTRILFKISVAIDFSIENLILSILYLTKSDKAALQDLKLQKLMQS